MSLKNEIVIIGGGHAGGMLAISLRKNKFQGKIVIITNENYLPYQRPPLSKGFISSDIPIEKLLLKSKDYYRKNNIEIIYGNVKTIIRNESKILLDDGKTIVYEKLILATGSKLNQINKKISKSNILYLKTIEDAKNIKIGINSKKSVCIIGGGYIGLEIAATASRKGLEVTILEAEDRVMKRVVCHEVSNFLEKEHRKEGVNIILSKKVIDIIAINNKYKIFLDDGTTIDSELLIAGIGITADERLAINCGLECNDGIIVNGHCQTSDPNIFAIGDCSKHPSKSLNRMIRLECVQNAVEQAIVLSLFILDSKTEYNSVPWFWSEQFDIKIQIVGLSQGYDDYYVKSSSNKSQLSVFYLKKNNLIAVDAINSSKDFLLAKKLIRSNEIIGRDFLEKLEVES